MNIFPIASFIQPPRGVSMHDYQPPTISEQLFSDNPDWLSEICYDVVTMLCVLLIMALIACVIAHFIYDK